MMEGQGDESGSMGEMFDVKNMQLESGINMTDEEKAQLQKSIEEYA
jgi:hypothetical protein